MTIEVVIIMFSFDEIGFMLDDVADSLPEEVFSELNGGVSLLQDTKISEENLYVLGEYRRDQMGRYIVIYYGSICAVYPNLPETDMRIELKNVLTHELTHHLESMAGERWLEIEDELDLQEYRQSRIT